MIDLIRFNIYHQVRSPVFIGVVAFIPVVAVPAIVLTTVPPETLAWVKVVMIAAFSSLAALMSAVAFVLAIVISVLLVPGVRRMAGWRRVSLFEGGILSESQHTKIETEWAGIEKIFRSRQLLVARTLGIIAHLVPRRAFASDEEWDRFYAFARRKFEECQAG